MSESLFMVDLREEEMTWFTCFHNFATKRNFFDGLNKKRKSWQKGREGRGERGKGKGRREKGGREREERRGEREREREW